MVDVGRLAGVEVAVTGASGFVGTHVVQALVDAGAGVTAVVADLGWRTTVADLVSQGRVRLCPLDRASPRAWEDVAAALDGVQAVAHLDYVLPVPATVAERCQAELAVNAGGALRLAGALPASLRRFCFASSAMVYGTQPPAPVSEHHPTQPATPYAVAKVAAEQSLALWAPSAGAGLTVLRYATVYGPEETAPRAIPNFIRAALAGRPSVIRGDGSEMRDYVHVHDVARATVAALADTSDASLVVNVGSGQGRTTADVAERVARLTGQTGSPERQAADPVPTRTVCDMEQARRLLGFEATVDFDEGLREEIAWFTAHRQWWDAAASLTGRPR